MSLKSDKLTEQMKPLLLASEEKSGIMISFQPQHMVETKVSSKIGKVMQLSILAKVSSKNGCRGHPKFDGSIWQKTKILLRRRLALKSQNFCLYLFWGCS